MSAKIPHPVAQRRFAPVSNKTEVGLWVWKKLRAVCVRNPDAHHSQEAAGPVQVPMSTPVTTWPVDIRTVATFTREAVQANSLTTPPRMVLV